MGIIDEQRLDRSKFTFVAGNHEQYGGDYPLLWQRFLDETGLQSRYYSRDVCGCDFIVLCCDRFPPYGWVSAAMSDEQLNWLDQKLSVDAQTGKQAYVYVHWTIPRTVAGSYPGDWAFDAENANASGVALRSILDSYQNVLVFTGHSHRSLDVYRGSSSTPLYINTGAISYLDDVHDDGYSGSQGWFVYVFANRVVLEGRDFAADRWTGQSFTFYNPT